jgi:hypothetical protein
MSQHRHYFTYPEAVALLPILAPLIERARAAKSARLKSSADLAHYRELLILAGGAFPNHNRIAALNDQARLLQDDLKNALSTIESLGVEVRDLERGRIVFPAIYQSRTICLCHELGDPTIQWWHFEEEGFASRQPVTPDLIHQIEIKLD